MAEIIDFQANQTPTFDPQKQYTWSEQDKFTFSGGEFGLILNALRIIVGTEKAQGIIMANDAAKVITDTLRRAVESGQVKEATQAQPEYFQPSSAEPSKFEE